MNTIQISITADASEQDLLIGMLSEFDPQGFEQTDTNLIAYFSENNFDSYEVNALLKGFAIETVVIPEQNWNAVWESNFEPVVVGNFCGIRASFHPPFEGVEYQILITPKMSFGTGHHATTYMMVEHMKDLPVRSASIFDFGTGTGILAILAAMMGASRVVAIDNDEWSIRNAIENAENNNCSSIDIHLSDELPSEKFDIILANINRNVILAQMEKLKNMMSDSSHLLLSGLMLEDESVIVEACKSCGLQLIKREARGNWISLLVITGK